MRDYAGIRRVLIITMALNWLATIAKLIVGYRTGTLSLTADGLDSFFDGLSNVAGIVAIGMAARPPDAEHPYGRRKYETIVALFIAALLAVTTWELVQDAIGRFLRPAQPSVTVWSFVAVLLGMALQGGASSYEFRRGRQLHSEVLIADARHSAANILVSAAVLVGLPFVRMGFAWVDPALTLAVALVIARLGIDILRESLPVLVDRAPVDAERIGQVVSQVQGVTSFHRVRSRGAADEATIDLHVRVDQGLPLSRADAIGDEVRDRLLHEVAGVSDVTVHVEPQRQDQASAAEVYAAIQRAAAGRPVTIHEVWAYHDQDGQTRAEAHIGVPPDYTVAEAHEVVSQMEAEIVAQVPWLNTFHTHIEPAFRELRPGELVPPTRANPIRDGVQQAVAAVPGAGSVSNLTVHSTPEGLFLALDCTVRADLTVSASHALAHAIAEQIRDRLPEVTDVAVRIKPEAEPGDPS